MCDLAWYTVLNILSLVRISRFSHFIPGEITGFLSEFLTKMRLQLRLKNIKIYRSDASFIDVCGPVYDYKKTSIHMV